MRNVYSMEFSGRLEKCQRTEVHVQNWVYTLFVSISYYIGIVRRKLQVCVSCFIKIGSVVYS